MKRFLHPRAPLSENYPNVTARFCIHVPLFIRREERIVNRTQQVCIIFRHHELENLELYYAELYAKVITERVDADFFTADQEEATQSTGVEAEDLDENHAAQIQGSDIVENIPRMRLEGYGVDDDNDPAIENILSH